MADMTLEQEILEVVRKMTPGQQRKLLEQARTIRPQGTPGKLAVQYAREIGFEKQDLAEMAEAIEEWCER
ncbi:MAG: hypothetical protein HZC41_22375 [Chloroflexi bacterium]|nr:hypothetical protein [Chloroflexota bacterium]